MICVKTENGKVTFYQEDDGESKALLVLPAFETNKLETARIAARLAVQEMRDNTTVDSFSDIKEHAVRALEKLGSDRYGPMCPECAKTVICSKCGKEFEYPPQVGMGELRPFPPSPSIGEMLGEEVQKEMDKE